MYHHVKFQSGKLNDDLLVDYYPLSPQYMNFDQLNTKKLRTHLGSTYGNVKP